MRKFTNEERDQINTALAFVEHEVENGCGLMAKGELDAALNFGYREFPASVAKAHIVEAFFEGLKEPETTIEDICLAARHIQIATLLGARRATGSTPISHDSVTNIAQGAKAFHTYLSR